MPLPAVAAPAVAPSPVVASTPSAPTALPWTLDQGTFELKGLEKILDRVEPAAPPAQPATPVEAPKTEAQKKAEAEAKQKAEAAAAKQKAEAEAKKKAEAEAKKQAAEAKRKAEAKKKAEAAAQKKAQKHHFATRGSWYVSQYGSKYNTREDVPGYDNANCGPTSLTMVAKAFGKVKGGPSAMDAAIEKSRRLMRDGSSERSGTSVAGIARGAQAYGLDAKVRWDAKLATIQEELAKGRLPIVHGTVIKDDGRVYGGHYYVVTAIKDGKAYLNDPAYPSGPRVIPASTLQRSIDTRGTRAMISVGP